MAGIGKTCLHGCSQHAAVPGAEALFRALFFAEARTGRASDRYSAEHLREVVGAHASNGRKLTEAQVVFQFSPMKSFTRLRR